MAEFLSHLKTSAIAAACALCLNACDESSKQTFTDEEYCEVFGPAIAAEDFGITCPECTNGQIKCSDDGNSLLKCIDNNGSASWQTETCSDGCENNACKAASPQQICTVGVTSCMGKNVVTCTAAEDGTASWQTVKSCSDSCFVSNNGAWCMDDKPLCTLKNNTEVAIVQWVDGDTVWVKAVGKGQCRDYFYEKDDQGISRKKNVRYDLRIHGIDAPECTKKQNSYYYYTCTKDTAYTNTNERYGYESWEYANNLLPFGRTITVSCDETEYDGVCVFDKTDERYLTYIGYTSNNASYDFSTEITRQGLAFSNTKFASSKRAAICAAQKEAINAKRNIWSLANTVSGVLSQMSTTKKNGLKNMESICNNAIK